MKKTTKRGLYLGAILGLFWVYLIYVLCRMMTHPIDTNPSVGKIDELEIYDGSIDLEKFDEGSLSNGIEYQMGFAHEIYDDKYVFLQDSDLTVLDREKIMAIVRVSNNTDEELSGLKMFCVLPESIGDDSVVADEMTVAVRLGHEEEVAQKQINLIGVNTPIETCFVAGHAGFIRKNDGALEKLPFYASESTVHYFDYWQNEGMELNVPAGETWEIRATLLTRPVRNFEIETVMSSGSQSGSSFEGSTALGVGKKFHVVSEVRSCDEVSYPLSFWITTCGDVEIVPGTMKIDGVTINDLVEQDRSLSYAKNYKMFEVGDLAAGSMMRLEFDAEIGVNVGSSDSSWIRVNAMTQTGDMAPSRVSCDMVNSTSMIIMFMIASLLLSAVLILSWKIWKIQDECDKSWKESLKDPEE